MSAVPLTAAVPNINVGVLGHVDSGKTSLARALSTTSSTAAFDKNPQSRERGITLDLGFSSFRAILDGKEVQYTLVDCPGHASLIKTIIGGAQIIDLMVLVVDAAKGIQTQTAECLVIGEITCPRILVAINKIDLLPENKRQQAIDKMTKKLRLTLSQTRFQEVEVVAVAARQEEGDPIGLDGFVSKLKTMTKLPERDASGELLFSVDHCFNIRGQGTVMTGTILQGSVRVNDNVEIAALKESRKVKSIQMFRQPVQSAMQGDRVGLCVTQFDAKALERGIVCRPGYVPTLYGGIMKIHKISYYKGEITSGSKFHISLGHETVLAKLTLFCDDRLESDPADESEAVDKERDYRFLEKYSDCLDDSGSQAGSVFAILEFERPVSVIPKCKVLGSKLDTDAKANICRLAFHGKLGHNFKDAQAIHSTELPALRIFKEKCKEGVVERANNECEVICKGMFKKDTNLALFSGLRVHLSTGEEGVIAESFGQSGKFKVRIAGTLQPETFTLLGSKKKKGSSASEVVKLTLRFKKYIFSKKMAQ